MAEIDHTLKKPFVSKQDRRTLEEQKEDLTNRRVQLALEDGQDQEATREHFRENSISFRAFAESQKSLLKEIKELWDQLPGDTHFDKLSKSRLAQEQTVQSLSEQLGIYERVAKEIGAMDISFDQAQTRANTEDKAITDGRIAAAEAFFKKTGVGEGSPEKVKEFLGPRWNKHDSSMPGGGFVKEPAAEFWSAMDALDKRQETNDLLQGQLTKINTRQDFREVVERRDSTRKQLDEARVQLDEANSPIRETAATIADRRNVALQIFRARSDAYGVGDGAGEQMFNRMQGMRSRNKYLELHDYSVNENENRLLEILTNQVDISEQLVQAKVKLIELGKEEQNIERQKTREQQRGLLTSGPGELLRKLAVNQLSRGGRDLNAGQFFALSTEARGDFMAYPGQTEEMRENRRSQKFLRRIVGNRSTEDLQREYVQASQARQGLYERFPTSEINASAREAAGSVSALGNSAARAEAQIDSLATRISNLLPTGGASGAPPNPQSVTQSTR